jgi:hypothetical protein
MVHRTMQGKVVDMEKLMRQHELTPAIGNMQVNARGDELGQGGKIVRKREEVVKEYYEGHPESKPTLQKTSTIQPTKK